MSLTPNQSQTYVRCRRDIWAHSDQVYALGRLLEMAGQAPNEVLSLEPHVLNIVGKSVAEHIMAIESHLDDSCSIPDAQSKQCGQQTQERE